ncbi:MAG: hypothetical protein PUB89_10515 [Oscillospiraceae bacterium]|nr:hypothetical protein [Oscillospiraceae bacterium]
MEIVEYIRSQNNYKADNLLREMKRREIDNLIVKESFLMMENQHIRGILNR